MTKLVNLSILGVYTHAGPISALGSMGRKPTFRCHFLNIGVSYKQWARKSFV